MERFPRTATFVIAIVTAAAWALTALAGYSGQVAYTLGFIPLRVQNPGFVAGAVPAFLTPLTATLAHGDWMHIGFNLLFLVFFGQQVERIIGRAGFIVLYIAGAYLGAAAQWAVDPANPTPYIGASAAVSALVGAYALSFGRAKPITSNLRLNRWIQIVWLFAAWLVFQLLMGWMNQQAGLLTGVMGHVGGFAAGLLLQRPLLLWRYRNA